MQIEETKKQMVIEEEKKEPEKKREFPKSLQREARQKAW